jgi:hypothetical protein
MLITFFSSRRKFPPLAEASPDLTVGSLPNGKEFPAKAGKVS